MSYFTRFLSIYFNILSVLSFDFSTFKGIQNNHFCTSSTIFHTNFLVVYNLLYMTTFKGYMLAHFWDLRINLFLKRVFCKYNRKTQFSIFMIWISERNSINFFFNDRKYASNYLHDELTVLNYFYLSMFLVLNMFLTIDQMK